MTIYFLYVKKKGIHLFLFHIFLIKGIEIPLCGNYCGPDWCGGKKQPECANIDYNKCIKSDKDCVFEKLSLSCGDECCKKHDTCCSSSNREPFSLHRISFVEVFLQTGWPRSFSCYLHI